ncbi:tape measure protein [Fructobacillus sp. W13]|uniref:Tape measure protein n=1 Tax=Fructobacillus apis TaxID=2935017 RepID=A0ABT0ZPI8_9LACO|nr:tape measure protein [Fructobacillus apis]MCO0831911.1 tape measure protein [Fructobacillus apis]
MADNYSINAVFSLKDMFSGPLDKIKRNMHDTAQEPKKLTDSLAGIAKGAGVFTVVSKGLDTVKDSVGSAVARFDTLNQYPKVMKQMGYSTDDTNQAINVLKSGIEGLPTALQDITKNAQSFAILTGSAKKGADTANALNDAFLASGASAADASRGVQQYSQMLAAGKVDMQSWKTLQETMPYALNEVAKSFGLTGDSAQKDLYAKLQSGDITMSQLNDRFMQLDGGLNGFATTARTATGGINTSFANMKNAIVKGITDSLTSVDNGLKSAGINRGIAGLLDQVTTTIKSASAKINTFIGSAIPEVVSMLSGLFSFVENNKDWLGPLVAGILSATIAFKAFMITMKATAVISSIVKEIQLIVFAFNNVRASIGAAKAAMFAFNVATGANPIGAIVLAVVALVGALVWFFTQTKIGKQLWADFVEFLKNSLSALAPIFNEAMNALKEVVLPVLEVIASEIGMWISVIWNIITTAFNSIMITIKTVWNIIVIVISTAWNNITAIISIAINVVANLIKLATSLITGDWSGAMEAISNIAGAIWDGVTSIFSNSLNAIGQIVGQIGNWIVSQFNNAISGFSDIARSIFNGVRKTISEAMDIDLFRAGKAIIDGFVKGVKETWEKGKKIFKDITDAIPKLKGPYSYDKVLLTPAGNAIMDGLNNGIMNGYKTVKSNLSGMADNLESEFSGQLSADTSQTNRSINQVELTANNSTNGLLREVVKAIREGQVITINGNQMIGATANGYDGALGDIMTDRRRNQL